MDTLPEIEAAVDALPVTQQKELLRRLAERLRGQQELKRQLPLVAPTGNPIPRKRLTTPSMPTEGLLDVKVVIASLFADHVMHL